MATAAQPSSAGRHRLGLRRLSPDQIGKAINETEKQVNSIMLAFIGAAAFCVLSLLTPDSALLGGSDKVNVPLAGPVSFLGFIIIGPAVLIVLRVYLEIYIDHGKRLARVARLVSAKRDPTLLSSQNAFLRIAFALVLSLLLPLTLFLFAWKAAVFPAWGAGLLCVAAAVIAGHAMLPLRRVSWRTRVLLSVSVALLAGGAMLGWGPPHRSFDLFRANLSGQQLIADDLRGADLRFADLRDADVFGANLRDAHLNGAHLNFANFAAVDLTRADLSAADLTRADLEGAKLNDAGLYGAKLNGTDLRDAHNLTQPQLAGACGTGAELPPGLTLKPCRE
jgi:Pentapeptide repeats (8 copies)